MLHSLGNGAGLAKESPASSLLLCRPLTGMGAVVGMVPELLCLVAMAKVWGWKDPLAGSSSPRISPFWLLTPLPEIPRRKPAVPGDREKGVPKVGVSQPHSVCLRGGSRPADCLLGHCYQGNSPAARILFLCRCCLALQERGGREKHRKRQRRKQNHLLEGMKRR